MKKIKLNTTFKWGAEVPKMKKKIFDGERVLIRLYMFYQLIKRYII